MSFGTIAALVITAYISMFLLTYFMGRIYIEYNSDYLYQRNTDYEFLLWVTCIFWIISLPLWFVYWLSVSFFGIFKTLDNMAESVVSYLRK